MKPLAIKALIRVLSFVTWGSIGGVIFSSIERVGDQTKQRRLMLSSLNNTMSTKYNMTAPEFVHFTKMAYEALRPPGPRWDITDGLDFAFQTITTIGYGTITPVTQLGQGLCILFSTVGIPITLLALKSVGELIKEDLTKLIQKFETKLLKREQVYNCEAKCAVVSFLITVAMLCLGAGFSMQYRDWTFLEGIYFWFISFSTVGFGDYTPNQVTYRFDFSEEKRLSITIFRRVLNNVWYVLGLCMVSSVISSIQWALEKNSCHNNCHGCLSRRSRTIDGEVNGDGVAIERKEDNVVSLLVVSAPEAGKRQDALDFSTGGF